MKSIFFLLLCACCSQLSGQYKFRQPLLFGAAYYEEYMPYDRLNKDIDMMKAAGINVVRIAESTWSTVEPADSVYDFSHIDRVLNAMHKAGIHAILGTPTYALPAWLVHQHPDVLAETPRGKNQYGPRQNMDISNPHFRYYAERVIRKIIEHVKDHPAIIGYQIDNETKPYNTAGPEVQKQFVQYMRQKFGSLDSINRAFGLDYWSNRINSWEEFPSMNGSINASELAEFAKFQRKMVTDYLRWQNKIVNEYKKPSQFITHNFDFEWRGYSYGIQPDVNHFDAATATDIAGIDVYHPTQDDLTGIEISFGGDLGRSMHKGQNYLVLETQAQGFPEWTPYPGQLRLQAFSHLASGANMVEYWHWHSIHNSAETYWKGLLSHDFEPNPTYEEAKTIGKDFQRLSEQLVNLTIKNKAAILFSNEALTGFNQFGFGWYNPASYNDILRPYYDALYKMNVGVDFIDPSRSNLNDYALIVVPALYAAPDSLLEALNAYVKQGGHVLYTLKSGFADQHVKVRSSIQPGIINKACGIEYSQFTIAKNAAIKGSLANASSPIGGWMELIKPTTAQVLAQYDHPVWKQYAAITQNKYGQGTATYVGCMIGPAIIDTLLSKLINEAGLRSAAQSLHFPLITKQGTNTVGKSIRYIFNYSAQTQRFNNPFGSGTELLTGKTIANQQGLDLPPWGVMILSNQDEK
jgi:beta-galactosidase